MDIDLGRKSDLYEAAGTSEYWVIDLNENRALLHHQPSEEGYLGQAAILFGEAFRSATKLYERKSGSRFLVNVLYRSSSPSGAEDGNLTSQELSDGRNVRSWIKQALSRPVPLAALLVVAVLLIAPQILPNFARRLLPRSDGAAIEGLELKDFIVKVKADLAAAESDGLQKGERPLLELEDVELVVNFVVTSSAQADVKLVTVNGSALSGLERSQRITLRLKPVPPEEVDIKPERGPIVTNEAVIGPSRPPEGVRP